MGRFASNISPPEKEKGMKRGGHALIMQAPQRKQGQESGPENCEP